MKLNMRNLKKVVNTAEVKSLVSSWLLAEAGYNAQNAHECEIYAEILREIPLWADCKHGDGKRITQVKDMYLSVDEESCQKVYERATAEFIAEGILPVDSQVGTSISYEFWKLRSDAEREIVRLTGEPFGITSEKLYCTGNGVEDHKTWIKNIVGAIMSLPDFKSPEFPNVSY
jgi:hypothetical protein